MRHVIANLYLLEFKEEKLKIMEQIDIFWEQFLF